jgi:hypothetical protein
MRKNIAPERRENPGRLVCNGIQKAAPCDSDGVFFRYLAIRHCFALTRPPIFGEERKPGGRKRVAALPTQLFEHDHDNRLRAASRAIRAGFDWSEKGQQIAVVRTASQPEVNN